ncbi:MAG: LytR C-terminal domain-containing protein [Candidatus Pacebacteria bacterium]|nr:LytR C-terminal domain-containing protein [Candidatus Paceibacterota bacterium]
MPRRKSARSKSRSSSIVKKFFKIIISVFILFILITAVLFVFFIIVKPDSNHKNIVFTPGEKSGVEGEILLAEFYEKTNSIYVIKLNGEIKSELMGGYGEYQLKAINGILKIDKKGRGYKEAAFGHFLKRGIDQVVEYKSGSKLPENKIELMKFFIENKETIFDSLLIKDTDSENIIFLEINNKEEWEKYLKKQLTWKINEECTVAVVNSTSSVGLATDFGQILENSGIEVVRSTNNIWGESKTAFYVDNLDSCGQVKQRVKSLSPISLEEDLDTGKTSEYRANMVLFIGDELAEYFKD